MTDRADKCSDDLDHDPFSMALRKKKTTTNASPLLPTNAEELSLSRRLTTTLRESSNNTDSTNAQWAANSTAGRSAVHEWGNAGSVTSDRLAVSLHGGDVGGGPSSQSEKIQAAIQERRRSAMFPTINPTMTRRPRYVCSSTNLPSFSVIFYLFLSSETLVPFILTFRCLHILPYFPIMIACSISLTIAVVI